MTRFIYTDPFSQSWAEQLAQQKNYTAVTPSRLACRAINARYQPLHQFALQQIQQRGQACASPLKSLAAFRRVLQEIFQFSPKHCLGIASAWLPSVKALLESGCILQLSGNPNNCAPQTHQLLAAASAYQTALRDDSLIDSSELYWRAADSVPAQKQLLVYGYFQPQKGELAWLNQLAAPDSVIFLPQDESDLFAQTQSAIDWLTEKGWEVTAGNVPTPPKNALLYRTFLQPNNSVMPDSAIDLESIADTVVAHSYGTFEAEVRGTLAAVKALRSAGVPARKIAIIARDERAYGPKLLDIAWEYDIPLRALYSTPLLTTRLGAWLQLLLEVLDLKFPFEETAKLLSHPLCSNPESGFWATARQEYPSGFGEWRDIAVSQLGIDLSVLDRARQVRRRDTWVEWLTEVFKTFELRRRCARWARESVAFNNLQKALVEISKPENDRLSWRSFKQQIEDLLAYVTVPAQPGRGGVELHSPASMMGAQYAHLFVVGIAEGILPPAVSNDPVLDFAERSHLKAQNIYLPSVVDLYQKEALDFYFLLQAATDQLTFSYAKLKERKEQLPSPYLKRLNILATRPPEQPIASLEEERQFSLQQSVFQQNTNREDPVDSVLVAAVHAFEVERDRESTQPANEYDGVIDVPFDYSNWTFSVSQLTMLGQCPFKWFTNKVLKLGSPVEADSDLSPSLRGSLYHKAVELLVIAVQANPELTLTDLALLREKFLEAETAIALPTLPAWNMRREDHLRQLSIVLRKPDFWPSDAEPIALEEKFSGEWEGLQVTGRIDRIDRAPNGLVLIDYKTSSKAPKGLKDSHGKASIDLQLALYREAAVVNMFPGEAVADTQYFSLTKGEKLKASSKATRDELSLSIETCKEALNKGHYPVQPDVKQAACRYCDFDLVCRKGNRLTRKENPWD